jgi:hypothetical protein
VDVHQPVAPCAHEKRRQHAHEAGERDEFDIALDQEGVEVALERFAVLAGRKAIIQPLQQYDSMYLDICLDGNVLYRGCLFLY